MPTADVNGTTLAYDDTDPGGAGRPALVFSHSLFFDRTMFAHQVEHFREQYRVITYDHRGQGGSAPAPLAEQDMDVLAADAAALIEHLDLGPTHVLGNSMGGFIALRLAARRPDLVASAVALGSSAEAEGKIAEFGPLVEAMQQHGAAGVVDTLMYIMFGDTTLASPQRQELRERWYAHMSGLGPGIGDSAHAVVYRTGILDELARAQVPVLAVSGSEDHAYPPEYSERIARTAPHGRHVGVPGAGHSVSVEDPEAVNAIVAEHLAAVRVRT